MVLFDELCYIMKLLVLETKGNNMCIQKPQTATEEADLRTSRKVFVFSS